MVRRGGPRERASKEPIGERLNWGFDHFFILLVGRRMNKTGRKEIEVRGGGGRKGFLNR